MDNGRPYDKETGRPRKNTTPRSLSIFGQIGCREIGTGASQGLRDEEARQLGLVSESPSSKPQRNIKKDSARGGR